MSGQGRRALITAKVRYDNAVKAVPPRRDTLRKVVERAQSEGATIVEIAETLNWSRQSVYDLLKD